MVIPGSSVLMYCKNRIPHRKYLFHVIVHISIWFHIMLVMWDVDLAPKISYDLFIDQDFTFVLIIPCLICIQKQPTFVALWVLFINMAAASAPLLLICLIQLSHAHGLTKLHYQHFREPAMEWANQFQHYLKICSWMCHPLYKDRDVFISSGKHLWMVIVHVLSVLSGLIHLE